jgi:PAS domain S-box-containing protein
MSEHQARLEAAPRGGRISAWSWDRRDDLVQGDSNLNAMFGLAAVAGEARPVAEYWQALHPDDRFKVSNAIDRALAIGGEDDFQTESRILISGRECWISSSGTVVRSAQGAAMSLLGMVQDITEQKLLDFERQRLLEHSVRQARVFDTTLSAITDYAYSFDLDGRFLYANKALLQLWGLAMDEAVGRNFFDLKYPDSLAARLQQQIQQVIDTGEALSDETQYTSPTGAGGYYEYIFAPVFAGDGSVEVVVGSTRDVTARRQTENALRARTAQFESLLNDAPFGVYLVDADFLIREVNPPARLVFGDIPRLIGRNFAEVIHTMWPPHYADELVERFRHTQRSGEAYAASERVEQRRDRQTSECHEWKINRIPLPDGRYGVVCYFHDISAQLRVLQQLEAADHQKNEFLAVLAHELRNPLAPIRNASELLSRRPPVDHSGRAAIEVIKRQVGVMTRLVDDLMDVARIAQGRIELKRVSVELGSVITQAVETVEPMLQKNQQRVSIISSECPLRVSADPVRLGQCVANILSNSAKYSNSGGEIRIRICKQSGEGVLTITDDGAGISKELLPNVFDLFVQSDRTLDRAEGGLGIGLAVVKRLIEMHGGRVRASSQGVGQGSTFEIRLPLIVAAPEPPNEINPPAEISIRRILIVDDNVDAANSLDTILTLDGHQTQTVYTASDALSCVVAFRPDLVLLDIGLPGMDGYEVARRMRALPELVDTHLVALTGYAGLDDRMRAADAGFVRHLVKPIDFSELQEALVGSSRSAR